MACRCTTGAFRHLRELRRLREACQTKADGTSIDILEEMAVQLGLEAEQVMVPVDHLLRPEAHGLPAIVVLRQAEASPTSSSSGAATVIASR